MTPRARLFASLLLILLGVALVVFYVALLGIADCSQACIERGEQAVPVVLIALGIGLATTGALLTRGTRRAVAMGILVGGAAATLGALWTMVLGARGVYTWAALGVGLAAIGQGAWMLYARRR